MLCFVILMYKVLGLPRWALMVNNPSANAGETKETEIQFLGWD